MFDVGLYEFEGLETALESPTRLLQLVGIQIHAHHTRCYARVDALYQRLGLVQL
jgi:hypothetical protein